MALTNAEHQALWRRRRTQRIEELEERVAELEAQLQAPYDGPEAALTPLGQRLQAAFPSVANDGSENGKKVAIVLACILEAARKMFPGIPQDDTDWCWLLTKWEAAYGIPTVTELRDGTYITKLRAVADHGGINWDDEVQYIDAGRVAPQDRG